MDQGLWITALCVGAVGIIAIIVLVIDWIREAARERRARLEREHDEIEADVLELIFQIAYELSQSDRDSTKATIRAVGDYNEQRK